jgi:GTPase involved in cell partitioning and DNA repair
MLKAYKEVRKELSQYGQELDEKEEIIILTKTDVVEDSKRITKEVEKFKKINKNVFTLSLFDDKMVKKLNDNLAKILRKK